MKLCFILNQLYKSGGIERTISHRLSELSKNHEVYVLTVENGQNPFYFGKDGKVNYIDLNVKFKRNADGGFKKNLYNILYSIFLFIKLQIEIIKIKPDITVNVIGEHTLYFIPLLFGKGKTVLEHHASFYQYPPSNLKRKIMNRFMYHVFLTKEEADLAYFIKNKTVIPNSIKVENHKITPYFSRKNKIIAAGRIVEIKGFDRLILAWSLIQNKHPDWILEIYGDGNKKILDDLNHLILKLNISNRVYIKPSTPYIFDIMSESKIYAMTSYYESFGMVLLEAMSAGMQIITFDCPTGPRNIIDDQIGFLVEDNNIELFSRKLSEIMFNKNNVVKSDKAYTRSLEYSVSNITKKWNDFFFAIK